MIIHNKEGNYDDIVCFYIKLTDSMLYVTEHDFLNSESSTIINTRIPSWWRENHIDKYIVSGPDQLKEIKDIYSTITEPEYYIGEELKKLSIIREDEYNRQIEELVLSHFNSIDSYLEKVKSDKYKDIVEKNIHNGYEIISYEEFKMDSYLAMRLETVKRYVDIK